MEPSIQKCLTVAANLDVPIILMHMRGTPQTMQQMTDYQDVVADIIEISSAAKFKRRSLVA